MCQRILEYGLLTGGVSGVTPAIRREVKVGISNST